MDFESMEAVTTHLADGADSTLCISRPFRIPISSFSFGTAALFCHEKYIVDLTIKYLLRFLTSGDTLVGDGRTDTRFKPMELTKYRRKVLF
jgi:alkylated DNA repair dioxygenase AlkB